MSIQAVFVLGIALNQIQDILLDILDLHDLHMVPALKLVKVRLDGVSSLECVDPNMQLRVIRKLEHAFSPTVHITNSVSPNNDL